MASRSSSGLTVHVEEDRAAPVAAIQLWVRAGSADEGGDESGLAHLCERLAFQGTRKRRPDELGRVMEAAGGKLDAWTSFDQTVYRVEIASRFWQTGLAVLAESVCDADYGAVEISRALDAVCAELDRAADSPGQLVSEALFDAAYEEHPYGLPVLGSELHLRAHTPEAVLRFRRRWYLPENMVLVVTGDVGEAEVLESVDRLFRFDPAATSVPFVRAPRPAEQRHDEPRARVQRHPSDESHLVLAWPAPPAGQDDVPALEALALVLGHGERSRLLRALKRDPPLVNSLHASCYTAQDPGLALLSFTLAADDLPATIREAARQLHRLRAEEISQDELDRARRWLERDAIQRSETSTGRAHTLGLLLCSDGGLAQEERYFARLSALTPSIAREAARRWFEPSAVVGAALLPPDADESFEFPAFQQLLEEVAAEGLDVELRDPAPLSEAAPSPRRMHAFAPGTGNPGPLLRERLPGGGTLLIRQERAVPLVSMHAVWSGGQRAETAALGGAQLLLARLAGKGDAASTARMEALGCALIGDAGRNSFGVRAEALSRDFAPAWELFADALANPSFRSIDVERELELQRKELRARDEDLAGSAFQLFVETMFLEHPNRLDMRGSEQSLAKLDGASLAAIQARLYRKGAPVIAIVGDIDPREVRARVLGRLGAPGPLAAELDPPREPKQLRARAAVRAIERAESHLVVGHPGLSMGDPDRETLAVLCAILSGRGGRLFRELRGEKRLARGAGAFSMEGVEPGWFAVHVDCDPNRVSESLACVREELARLREELPDAVELERARNQLIGRQARGLQRAPARAAQLAFDEGYGLGAEWSRGYPERVDAVTSADVRTLAATLLLPERETVALLAPQASVPDEFIRASRLSGNVRERRRGDFA